MRNRTHKTPLLGKCSLNVPWHFGLSAETEEAKKSSLSLKNLKYRGKSFSPTKSILQNTYSYHWCPQSVSVVTAEDIKNQGFDSIEISNYTPGLNNTKARAPRRRSIPWVSIDRRLFHRRCTWWCAVLPLTLQCGASRSPPWTQRPLFWPWRFWRCHQPSLKKGQLGEDFTKSLAASTHLAPLASHSTQITPSRTI